MSENDHKRWNEDLAAYMLGALGPEEATALERHAEDCERCRTEMRWLTPAVQAISESPERVEPPRELRARVMGEVRADAGERAAAAAGSRDADEAGPLQRASGWLRNLGSGPMGLRPVAGVATAVLVVAAVAGYALGGGIGGDSDSGGGTNTVISGQPPGITAEMVDEGDGGTLRLENVKQLPSDRVLQAWVQRDGEVESVRALFVPDRAGRASTELPEMSGVEAVMVTAEPQGGSEAPTSKPIVTIPVPQ
jgi:anti-sigma-K factor RskA